MGQMLGVEFKIKESGYSEKLINNIAKNIPKNWKIEEIKDQNRISGLKVTINNLTIGIGMLTHKHVKNIPSSSMFVSVGVSFSIAFKIDNEDPKDEQNKGKENLEIFIKCAKIVYNSIHPEFGFGDEEYAIERHLWHFKNSIVWLNFFGPEMVKKIGMKKLLTAPAYKIEEMDDGGIMMQVYLKPRNPAEGKKFGFTIENVMTHLGKKYEKSWVKWRLESINEMFPEGGKKKEEWIREVKERHKEVFKEIMEER